MHSALTLPPALTLLVYALAVARGTVLVTEDRITEKPRTWALARLEDRDWRRFRKEVRRLSQWVRDHPGESIPKDQADAVDALGAATTERAGKGYLSYLLTCQWCASVWIGGLAAYVWWNWPDQPWSLGPAVLLAFSMIAGKLSQIGG